MPFSPEEPQSRHGGRWFPASLMFFCQSALQGGEQSSGHDFVSPETSDFTYLIFCLFFGPLCLSSLPPLFADFIHHIQMMWNFKKPFEAGIGHGAQYLLFC